MPPVGVVNYIVPPDELLHAPLRTRGCARFVAGGKADDQAPHHHATRS
jgi:hypothetical protein